MTMTTSNSVTFPSAPSAHTTPDAQSSGLSISHHATALEICDLVYGPTPPSWDAIERFYEPSATYENPILTATSREVIADIHCLSSQLAQVDIPKPVAVLFALFGVKRTGRWKDPWFRAIRVWSEINDVCESDSFDGHHKTIVEHTLNILLLPGLHSSTFQPPTASASEHPSAPSDVSVHPLSTASTDSSQHTTLGLNVNIPSPFHLRLPIMTRLLFNDVGRITHHRDFWDAKDLLGLVPGMSLTQWITSRIFAQGVRGVVGIAKSLFSNRSAQITDPIRLPADEEEGLSPAQEYARSVKAGIGRQRSLHGHGALV
ncbi:hypothetical protein QCA50_000875 [Cerrena zonata]|uniref:Uncharacterized protein n=1 Tax=Cerrena zonata TaxID=2478898 RepID=A0AAW0GZQ1_9APHY